MKWIFRLVLFLVFFNIAAMFIASTNFFPNTLYGDALGVGDDPEDLKTPEEVFISLAMSPGGVLKKFLGYELSFGVIMTSLVLIGLVTGVVAKSSLQGIATGLIGYLFVAMYQNSKQAISSITANMDSSVNYIVLMVGVGILIMFVITMMDYAGQQRSGGD